MGEQESEVNESESDGARSSRGPSETRIPTPILAAVKSQIDALLASAESVSGIGHGTTVGTIREHLLIRFFQDLIPHGLGITSGVVCDSWGRQGRQTDFIVYEPAILPAFTMMPGISLVGMESVYLCAEIKSTLEKKHLEKFTEDISMLQELEPVRGVGKHDVHFVVLAFKSVVAHKTIEEWLEHEDSAISVCVFDQGSFHKESDRVTTIMDRHEGVVSFIREMNRHLHRNKQLGRGKTSFDQYLVAPKE